MKAWLPFVVAFILLSGCSFYNTGDVQDIRVKTVCDFKPVEDARCELIRGGAVIAVVNSTPETVSVSKSREDIRVVCEKAGYKKEVTIAALVKEACFISMTCAMKMPETPKPGEEDFGYIKKLEISFRDIADNHQCDPLY